MSASGHVHLVGAGPGDPGLLTITALQRLQGADVVVYDRLVSQQVMDLVPPGVTRIFVGKMSGCHHMSQQEINALLVKLALSGYEVVRLKGGDPLTFARGSEEAAELAQNHIQFSIIPGITAAAAISAATGIPLTHRGLASGVRFVTGHCRENGDLDLNWASLADPDTTLIIYMGLANLREITQKLIAAGLPADTPACAVSNGTLANQRQCISTLDRLAVTVCELELPSPILLVIGAVTRMMYEINWQGLHFETIERPEKESRKVQRASKPDFYKDIQLWDNSAEMVSATALTAPSMPSEMEAPCAKAPPSIA